MGRRRTVREEFCVMSFHTQIPDPNDVLALEPEELAGPLLVWLNSSHGSNTFSRHNFSQGTGTVSGYPQQFHQQISKALMEAWSWLDREGFIVPAPGQEGWFFISRRGKRITEAAQMVDYRRGNLLPKEFLHPLIAAMVYPAFLRGDYDTAVFQAFKKVEVRVREAGGFTATDLGTDLMRRAFHPQNGPLSDQNVVSPERQ